MQEEIEAKLTEEELDTIDVHDYLTSREIWVTEFNCNQDGDCPTSEEQCQRITGQHKSSGIGPVALFDQEDWVKRWAWWPLTFIDWPERAMTMWARIADDSNNLLPVGRAFKYNLDPVATQCTAMPQWDLPSEILSIDHPFVDVACDGWNS